MAEWQKILISALAGLFTGLVAEPLRTLLQQTLVKRRISALLIDEILENSFHVVFAMKLSKGRPPLDPPSVLVLSRERYEHIRDRERSTLYLIKGYKGIDNFFKAMQEFSGKPLPLSPMDEYNLLIQFDSMKYDAEHGNLTRQFKNRLVGGKETRLLEAASMFNEFPPELPELEEGHVAP
jgi:hypothetical protein